ncbi:class I SAM-dependent methyltransferase [Verrucomicrobia bacterium]|nr:class I SAM-dependent methyltransferase [Verrucomicrobiota bacterium]
MQNKIIEMLPKRVRSFISNSKLVETYRAKQLAKTSKRIDICAAQIAHLLHMCREINLENKVCFELGSGWVLSHALTFYLLGAKKVYASDLEPHAHFETLSLAVKNSITSIPRDILSPFSDYNQIRQRLTKLEKIEKFNKNNLNHLGIEYVSPLDLAKSPFDRKVDFIYSNSVLEHVQKSDVGDLLFNMGQMLKENGQMLHAIHLEDHRDFQNKPFDFLSIDGSAYTPELQASRGNRIRYSQWMNEFKKIPNTLSKPVYANHREVKLPSIDKSIEHRGEEDLKVSHLCVHTKNTK